MACQGEGLEKQTEFEFFQQLQRNPDVLICAGPLTQIGFVTPALTEMTQALVRIGCSQDYLDLYEQEVLDSGHMSLKMCAKHWVHHAKGIGTIAVELNNDTWEQLAYFIFRVTCLTNDWDYKEVLNFVKTIESSKR